VAHINEHGKSFFGGILECCWTEHKGRIVHATRPFKQGELILQEPPLHIVQEDLSSQAFIKLKTLCKKHTFDYEPLWYWCALKSLTKEQLHGVKAGGWAPTPMETQRNLLLLHHEVTEPGREVELMAKELVPHCDPLILERLVQIWVLNCFEYSDTPQGYSTYFFSSFMSHSCFPNAVWHYTGTDHVLRARRDIKVGDEVCIAYLPEDGLLQPAPFRRWELHQTKHFWCACERCDSIQDLTRGMFCPKCKDGIVFSSAIDKTSHKAAYLASAWVGCACTKCGHKVTARQAEELAKVENELKQHVENYKDEDSRTAQTLTLKEAQNIEQIIEASFPQHAIADTAWERLAEWYECSNYPAEQRRILAHRCDFHAAAYPGLSGTRAWSLETRGDAIRCDSGRASQNGSAARRTKGRVSASLVKAEPAEAARCYQESLRILRLMFGEEHEYVTSVDHKLKGLLSALEAEDEKGHE